MLLAMVLIASTLAIPITTITVLLMSLIDSKEHKLPRFLIIKLICVITVVGGRDLDGGGNRIILSKSTSPTSDNEKQNTKRYVLQV